MTTARLTRNGQITIPKKIRETLSLQQGDIFQFFQKKGNISITPLSKISQKKQDMLDELDSTFANMENQEYYEEKQAMDIAIQETKLSRVQ